MRLLNESELSLVFGGDPVPSADQMRGDYKNYMAGIKAADFTYGLGIGFMAAGQVPEGLAMVATAGYMFKQANTGLDASPTGQWAQSNGDQTVQQDYNKLKSDANNFGELDGSATQDFQSLRGDALSQSLRGSYGS